MAHMGSGDNEMRDVNTILLLQTLKKMAELFGTLTCDRSKVAS